jgi:hypothetical protein
VSDLARLLVPPQGEDSVLRQARIREFDSTTFENVVEYEGTLLRNVVVGPGANVEALTYQPGDVVILEGWFPGGQKGELGIGTFAIRGRVIEPGAGAAEKTVAFMTTSLAQQVLADRVKFESTTAGVTTASGSYTALTGGPVIPDVEITAAGKALVGVQAHIFVVNSEAAGRLGHMSYSVSGATTRSALDANNLTVGALHSNLSNVNRVDGKAMAWSEQTGLSPGLHTFTAEYRASISDSNPITFQDRRLMVIAY